ncbi:hypothetical protein B0H13DRAFT_2279386 [Mycena leptocephala]|nr:hypothetical protein B0H13DRAFT_2279386 [Mycena leptocephala]
MHSMKAVRSRQDTPVRDHSHNMLLLLSLVYVLATNHHAVSGHPLDARDEPVSDSCDDTINNYRTLFGITSGCLATIFACTWVSVHPNVPPPNQSQLAVSWRRFHLMLVAVIAPELMVGFAARQFFDARWFSKEYGVSRTHGFFFTMGGFVSRSGHHPIVTQKQLFPEYLTAIQNIGVEDIEDKSKGDSLSKGVAVVQGLWFAAQCLARAHQHLPLTDLEVVTLAFQFVSVFIWLLWWNKPLDVQRPIPIGPGNDFLVAKARRATLLEAIGVAGDALVLGDFPTFDPVSSTSVPLFWSTHGHHKRDTHLVSIIVQSLVGAIFGAIHCAAWNAKFPSAHEMWMCSWTELTPRPGRSLTTSPRLAFDKLSTGDCFSSCIMTSTTSSPYQEARGDAFRDPNTRHNQQQLRSDGHHVFREPVVGIISALQAVSFSGGNHQA